MQPLDDLRVLDLSSGPVGGVATAVLADFGADVLKIEPPSGDRLRGLASAPLWLRGKRSAVLDLAVDEGRQKLRALARDADVVVSSFRPGRAARLGADYASLSRDHPRLVYCAITGWGARGPYADYPAWEGLVAAKSGRMLNFEGQRPRPGPGFAALPVAGNAAAQGAVHGICAALIARERSGRGALVETSLLQAIGLYDLFQLLTEQLARRGGSGEAPVPVAGMPTLNYHPVLAKDGQWIQLGNLLEHLFYAFLDATDLLPELLVDERFRGSPATWSPEATEEARDRILLRMRERSAEEWMEIFRANGNVAAEPYGSAQQALHHPDLVANGDVIEHEHPKLGSVRQVGPIARLCASPGSAEVPAPDLGQHPAAWNAAGRDARERERASEPPPPGRPLDGLTIVDFSTIIAGPLATSILADLGARVLKIEPPTGDPYRSLGQPGVLAAKTNTGKQSLCVDLKRDEGKEIVRRLLERADALLHNYRPGVPERLGIGYEQVRALRPDAVWVSANGYGPDAPGAARPATHPIPGALCGGALHQAGSAMPPDRCETLDEIRETARQLMRANDPNPDPNTSVVIASATLLALLHRARRGEGQAVYVNMFAANAWANRDDFLSYAGKPPRPAPDAEIHGLSALYRLYQAKSGWVFLAAPGDREWRALCRAAGWNDLAAQERFATASARRANDTALCGELARRFGARDADAWESLLARAGVGCVRADASPPGVFFADDPQMAANGFAPEATHRRFGRLKRWAPLVTCDGGAPEYGAAPLAGEQTDTLLSELGYTRTAIGDLRSAGIVASEAV